ncbi:MAG: hypothetical protein ACOC1U_02860 [Spirochaetota bacterium]
MSNIDHLVGLRCVTVFATVVLVSGSFFFALTLLVANILMNLYRSLLQQDRRDGSAG